MADLSLRAGEGGGTFWKILMAYAAPLGAGGVENAVIEWVAAPGSHAPVRRGRATSLPDPLENTREP